jgi:citrate lyase subunit beta / citryl-CoA lyase
MEGQMDMNDPKLLRSLLFVPATSEKFLHSAVRRGADAIQLDLEDAIAASEKEPARQAAVEAITWLQGRCPYIVTRINGPIRLAVRDLEAVVVPGLHAITVPKAPNAAYLRLLDETIEELEAERGLPAGAIRLIAMIETAEGLVNANEIAAATPRLVAMTVGPEDLAASLGAHAEPDAMYVPNMLALVAARRAGIIPLGYAGSISLYGDKATYRQWIERAARLGFEGAFCIHPNQVEICNEVFQPSPEEVDKARRLIEAYEEHKAGGVGVFVVDGRMVDAPVVNRARAVLAKAGAIAAAAP